MHDLKAAAKMMLDAAAATVEEMKMFRSGEWHDQAERERDAFLLAAQALEALVWQEEVAARVMHYPLTDQWTCETLYGKYYADTPLGAILAAMEGERDA